MSSIIELEEQRACLQREVEEQLDALNNVVWSVGASIDAAAEASCDALISMSTNAQLKTMDVFADHEREVQANFVMINSSDLDRFEGLKDEQTKNTEELTQLHEDMNYKTVLIQLDQYRAEIKDRRVKRNRKQHELSLLKQNAQAAKTKMTNTIDNLREALEALRSAIQQEDKELTVPVLMVSEVSSYLMWPHK